MNATVDSPPDFKACIRTCNHLLRGEFAALAAYDLAIRHYEGYPEVVSLERMRDEHRANAGKLRDWIASMGGRPSTGAGPWGVVARVFEAAAGIFGERPAVAALLEGEAYGIGEYEAALDNPLVSPECKSLIRAELVPRLREHMSDLRTIAA